MKTDDQMVEIYTRRVTCRVAASSMSLAGVFAPPGKAFRDDEGVERVWGPAEVAAQMDLGDDEPGALICAECGADTDGSLTRGDGAALCWPECQADARPAPLVGRSS